MVKFKLARSVLFLFLTSTFIIFLVGCRAEPAPAAKDVADIDIEFAFYYRKNTSEPHSAEKKITFKVDMQEGEIPEIGRVLKPVKADVGDFHVVITHDINSFYLDVYQKEDKSKYVLRQLYQLDRSVTDQFAGSHGFTGLVYVNHSKHEGELQFIGKVVK